MGWGMKKKEEKPDTAYEVERNHIDQQEEENGADGEEKEEE